MRAPAHLIVSQTVAAAAAAKFEFAYQPCMLYNCTRSTRALLRFYLIHNVLSTPTCHRCKPMKIQIFRRKGTRVRVRSCRDAAWPRARTSRILRNWEKNKLFYLQGMVLRLYIVYILHLIANIR